MPAMGEPCGRGLRWSVVGRVSAGRTRVGGACFLRRQVLPPALDASRVLLKFTFLVSSSYLPHTTPAVGRPSWYAPQEDRAPRGAGSARP